MASSFSKSLLASAVALVVAGMASAQESKFQEGVKFLRLGTPEDRVQALEHRFYPVIIEHLVTNDTLNNPI